MPSFYETFWDNQSFAVVGNSADKPFPILTFSNLLKQGTLVFPVDPSIKDIDGVPTFPDLASLPQAVEGVIIEVPAEQTAAWVKAAADAGIKHVWIHQGADTPEALAIGKDRGLLVRHGTCAVMYVTKGFAQGHGIHRFLWKALGKY
jgi:predicted CoA-binding protein